MYTRCINVRTRNNCCPRHRELRPGNEIFGPRCPADIERNIKVKSLFISGHPDFGSGTGNFVPLFPAGTEQKMLSSSPEMF